MAKLVAGRLKAQAPAGPHPDPELLSAFAENALPEADRGQLLLHLGACSDCREILYLALPDSPEAQKVLVLQPRPFTFRRWALGWGALVVSVAIAGVFFATNRLEHKNQSARMALYNPPSPAVANEPDRKIAVEKTPQELDTLQAARDALKPNMALTRGRSENKPQPEAKHMTGKMQPALVFEDSGQVHVQTPSASANAVGGLISKEKDDKDERQKESLVFGAARGVATPTVLAGKQEAHGYVTTAPEQARGDQPATTGTAALSADSELKSLPVEGRNGQGIAPLAWKAAAKGNLGGTVLDPSGAVVANAKVTMDGPIGEKVATSDPQGKFSFDSLLPGSYSVKAEASGFKSTEIKQVAVLDSKPANLQVRLDLGTASEVVEVSGEASAVAASVATSAAAPLPAAPVGLVAQSQSTAEVSLKKAAAPNARSASGSGSGAGAPTLRWTLSPDGAVQRSGDSGKSWQVVSVAPGVTFRALSAVGASVWAGGKAGTLYHSADSGQTWAKVEPVAASKNLNQDILKVDFSDLLTGTVNAANGEVWTTSDGGLTWQRK